MRFSPFVLAIFSAGVVLAQGIAVTANPSHIYALKIPAIAGAPFTAVEVLTRTITLDNGITAVRRAEMLVARDSQGRTYQEARQLVSDLDGRPPVEDIVVTDPAAHTKTTFDLRTHAVREKALAAPEPQCVDRSVYEAATPLGTMSFAGLPARGMRFATAGDVTNETWFNDDLHINLRMKMHDSRNDTILMQVKRIERGEPDPQLFQRPAGFELASEAQSIDAH